MYVCLALQAGGQLVVAVEEEEGRWPGVCKVCCRPKGPKGLLAEQFRQAGIAAYVVEGVFKVDEECDCVLGSSLKQLLHAMDCPLAAPRNPHPK